MNSARPFKAGFAEPLCYVALATIDYQFGASLTRRGLMWCAARLKGRVKNRATRRKLEPARFLDDLFSIRGLPATGHVVLIQIFTNLSPRLNPERSLNDESEIFFCCDVKALAVVATGRCNQPNMQAARSSLQTAKAELQRPPDKGGHRATQLNWLMPRF
jgi:hypothetical protein